MYILRIVGGIYTIDNIGIMSIGCGHWYILRFSRGLYVGNKQTHTNDIKPLE